MEILEEILMNTSLWEVMAFIFVIYLLFNPKLLRRITRLKIGELEVELKSLREEVIKDKAKIDELESDIEHDKRLFDDIMESFDPKAPISDLALVRQRIKSQANNLNEIESIRHFLKINSSPEEMFIAAVSMREKRPVVLLPDLISLLAEIAKDKKLGGFRLNTVWTLVSAVHLILIASIRDEVAPYPSKELLDFAQEVLNKLQQHNKVQKDRTDNPMKGIQGPIKYSLDWINKGNAKYKNNA